MSLRTLYFILTINCLCFAQQTNSFIVFSDSHYYSPSSNFKGTILYEIILAAIEEKVDFVFLTGDLAIRDRGAGANYDSLLSDWKFTLDTLDVHGIRLFACRGNNDVNSAEAWTSLFSGKYSLPGNGPDEEKYYTYSFTYDNLLFMSLDQYTNYNIVNQDWINHQLENNDKPFVFTAGHEPAFKIYQTGMSAYPAERDAFWTSLSNHNGRIYFSGHAHFYDHSVMVDEDDNPYNDIHQIVVGTGGGSLFPDSEYNGINGRWTPERIFHEKTNGYLLVEVGNSSLTTTWKHRTEPFKFEEGGDSYNYLVTSVTDNNNMPSEYKLYQNYPNPFNPSTTIKYSLPSVGRMASFAQSNNFEESQSGDWPASAADGHNNVILKVYNILGREITILVDEQQRSGLYEVQFDATLLPSGVYFYRLQAGDYMDTKKMLMIK